MNTVADWRDELVATKKTCAASHEVLVEKLRESRRKLAKQLKRMGLESSYQAKRDAEEKLRDVYYSNWLSAKYPRVDLSFAQGKWDLLIQRTTDGARIVGVKDRDPNKPFELSAAVNRFAIQEGSGGRDLLSQLPDNTHVLGKFSFPPFQANREKFRGYSGEVRCNRPDGSPRSLISKLRDVVAISLEAHAAAVRAGVGIGGAQFSRTLLWKPRLEDLYIAEEIKVRDDPAVLVMSGDRAHLIAFWDSPDESPIEGVLREFSEGTFDKIDTGRRDHETPHATAGQRLTRDNPVSREPYR